MKEYKEITEAEVPEYRDKGWLIHHEVQFQPSYFKDEETGEVYFDEDVCIRDDWYAATEEWVEAYHRSGGMWGYAD